MAQFDLTAGDDSLTGTDSDDLFSGPGGGSDFLDGGAGDDRIVYVSAGSGGGAIDGGAGTDTLVLDNLRDVALTGIEILDAPYIVTGLAQLASLSTLTDSANPGSQIKVALVGNETGAVDFSALVATGHSVEIVSAFYGVYDLTGTDGDDRLEVNVGGGALDGGDGADTLHGGGDNGVIIGGAGDDLISVDGGVNLDVQAGSGNDYLSVDTGMPAGGTIDGGSGSDTIQSGNLTYYDISGIEALDVIHVEATIAQLGAFQRIFNATAGGTVGISLSGAGGFLDLSRRTDTDDAVLVENRALTSAISIIGTKLNDTLSGSSFDDRLAGGNGGDFLNGAGGNDTLDGGDGNDTIDVGQAGYQTATGGAGNDVFLTAANQGLAIQGIVDGGSGTDTVRGAYLSDLVFINCERLDAVSVVASLDQLNSFTTLFSSSGPQSKMFIFADGDGGAIDFSARSGSGHSVYFDGSALTAAVSIAGTLLKDTLVGSSFSDTLKGGAGDDFLLGGEGIDTAVYSDALTGGVRADLSAESAEGPSTGFDTLRSIENLIGSRFSDTLRGSGGDNGLDGGDSGDLLEGLAGNDTLEGRLGNDTLAGGEGRDVLRGGQGNDVYVNPTGDTIVEEGAAKDRVESDSSFSLINIAAVENLTLTGNAGSYGFGNTGANILTGNAAGNLLRGLDGDDTLLGRAGDDRLDGGLGRDMLQGDAGADRYIYNGAAESAGMGRDLIVNAELDRDRFDFAFTVGAIKAPQTAGVLNTATFDADLRIAVHAKFAAGGPIDAVLFDPNGGDLDQAGHVYLVIDADNSGGYNASGDIVIELVNATGSLGLGDFI
ncbi:MAG: hypothetical protein IT548_05085 [Alphaproteobacteria bacterium]|nr:hypothetical protein [Alphaproteobacteria bacterium]